MRMKIQIDNAVRDMTPEEEAAFFAEHENLVPPDADEALTRYANELTGQNDPDLISVAETLITERIKEDS